MRLHTFFWLATALAVAFSAINWLGLAGWLATLVVFGSVAMHIAGNAIGTRMREATDRDLSRTHKRTSVIDVPTPSPSHLERHGEVSLSVSIEEEVEIGTLLTLGAKLLAVPVEGRDALLPGAGVLEHQGATLGGFL